MLEQERDSNYKWKYIIERLSILLEILKEMQEGRGLRSSNLVGEIDLEVIRQDIKVTLPRVGPGGYFGLQVFSP